MITILYEDRQLNVA